MSERKQPEMAITCQGPAGVTCTMSPGQSRVGWMDHCCGNVAGDSVVHLVYKGVSQKLTQKRNVPLQKTKNGLNYK